MEFGGKGDKAFEEEILGLGVSPAASLALSVENEGSKSTKVN